MAPLVLLGPQRSHPTLVQHLDRLGVDGPVAVVTAGWQEREAEDEELERHVGRPVVDLGLYAAAERVFARDEELFGALRLRQDSLRELQRLYRFRLDFVLEPARQLLAEEGESRFLEMEREAALEAVRRLDREHLARIRRVHREHDRKWPVEKRPAVVEERRRIASELEGCAALGIAGGHVAVLLNRLRLFGLLQPGLPGSEDRPILAWSAGAMALGERIVLFHDSPPQGAGNAEVLDLGLGLVPGVVALPHARRRLRLEDRGRVALLARRFAEARCLALDDGGSVELDGGGGAVRRVEDVRQLRPDGSVTPLEPHAAEPATEPAP